jgi:hypothetical protein
MSSIIDSPKEDISYSAVLGAFFATSGKDATGV